MKLPFLNHAEPEQVRPFPIPRKSVLTDVPVPAGHVRFPIEWEGVHFWTTGTPSGLKAAAELILAGLPTAAEVGVDMDDDKPHPYGTIDLGGGSGDAVVDGDVRLLEALRQGAIRRQQAA